MSRLAFLLACATPLVAAPVPKSIKPKAETELTGGWKVVERQNDARPINVSVGEYWLFGEDTYAIYDGVKDESRIGDHDRRCAGSREATTADDPTAIDLIEGRNRNVSRIAFDGDTLHIAITLNTKTGRPGEAKPAVGVAYIKLHRVDQEKLKVK